MRFRRLLVLSGFWLAAASPALALDGRQVQLDHTIVYANKSSPPAALRERGPCDASVAWAEIQALRAFTRMR